MTTKYLVNQVLASYVGLSYDAIMRSFKASMDKDSLGFARLYDWVDPDLGYAPIKKLIFKASRSDKVPTGLAALQRSLAVGSTSAPTLDQLGEIEALAWEVVGEPTDDLLMLSIAYCASMDRAELMLDIINGDYTPLEI
jgi:hypothetical protein